MKINDLSYNATGARYGYNSQEQLTELNLDGNHTTAEFWEYDARSARRWNLDPRPVASMSSYSTFQSNPIFFSDPNGDIVHSAQEGWNDFNQNGIINILGEKNAFAFREIDKDKFQWTVDDNFDISGYGSEQLEFHNKLRNVIIDPKMTYYKMVNRDEVYELNSEGNLIPTTLKEQGGWGQTNPIDPKYKTDDYDFKVFVDRNHIERSPLGFNQSGLTGIHELTGHVEAFISHPELKGPLMNDHNNIVEKYMDRIESIYKLPISPVQKVSNFFNGMFNIFLIDKIPIKESRNFNEHSDWESNVGSHEKAKTEK